MTTLTADIFRMVEAAKIVHAGTASDLVTPVLTCAWLEGTTLVSTDRYCVVTYAFPEGDVEVEGDERVAIPRDLLKWIGQQKPGHKQKIRVIVQERVVIAEVLDSQLVAIGRSSASRIAGNFPPVLSLTERWQATDIAEPVALGPDLLKRVLTPLSMVFRKEPVTFELGTYGASSVKSGPVRITKGPVTILVQPNMLK